MKLEYSGNVYKFPLDFNKGYAYAEIFDYSDVSDFDGRLMQVFDLIENEENHHKSIEEIKKYGVMFGPAPVNKYPKAKSKGGWTLYGKDNNYNTSPPFFKHLRGLLTSNNWSNLKPWFKQDRFAKKVEDVECEYEAVRSLETMILNHIDSIIVKITMMKIIKDGEKVGDYYDLKYLGHKNIYLQIVNTYYDKKTAEHLLSQLK